MVINARNMWLYQNKENWLCSTDSKRFALKCSKNTEGVRHLINNDWSSETLCMCFELCVT